MLLYWIPDGPKTLQPEPLLTPKPAITSVIFALPLTGRNVQLDDRAGLGIRNVDVLRRVRQAAESIGVGERSLDGSTVALFAAYRLGRTAERDR